MNDKLSFAKGYRARTLFKIFNFMFFAVVTLMMLAPIWKVIVDSFDTTNTFGFSLWPSEASAAAYKMIFSQTSLYKPFLVSCYVTLAGTFIGLFLCTTGAFVLRERSMPGNKLMGTFLLITMVFEGGLVPSFLVMKQLNLLNTYWAVILPGAMSVYNLILMRNFFEGIPVSLYESAELDGCTPIGVFFRIVLPLSKPAIASIGLFYAVSFWGEYTKFAIYISDPSKYNFQMRLRSLILNDDSIAAAASMGITAKSIQNAAIVVAILPFVFLYPVLQKYFVAGINLGAVKE